MEKLDNMIKSFDHYYNHKNDNDVKALLEDCVLVPDTNVLLSLFHMPEELAEKAIAALSSFGEKLFVPYQVAAEYHKNLDRVEVDKIKSLNKPTDGLNQIRASVEAHSRKFENADEKHPDFRGVEFIRKLRELLSEQTKKLNSLQNGADRETIMSLALTIREKLFSAINNPLTPEQIDSLVSDAKSRATVNFPPGYLDMGKSEKSDKYLFYEDDCSRPVLRAHGDLIIWHEILLNLKGKSVLLVTDDQKEDWYQLGITDLGPRRELIKEAKQSGIEDIWFISSRRFYKLQAGFDEEAQKAILLGHRSAVQDFSGWGRGVLTIPAVEPLKWSNSKARTITRAFDELVRAIQAEDLNDAKDTLRVIENLDSGMRHRFPNTVNWIYSDSSEENSDQSVSESISAAKEEVESMAAFIGEVRSQVNHA